MKAGTEFSGADAGGVETRFRSTADVAIDTVKIERLFVDQQGALVDITPQHQRGEDRRRVRRGAQVGASLVIALSAALHMNRGPVYTCVSRKSRPLLPALLSGEEGFTASVG